MSRWFSVCPHCGEGSSASNLLCSYCWAELCERLQPAIRPLGEQNSLLINEHLWPWDPGVDDLLTNLIFALKGREEPAAWRQLAELFLQNYTFEPGSILVPVPTKRHSNHALGLARALSYWSGLELRIPLTYNSEYGGGPQRRLSKRERLEQSQAKFIVNSSLSALEGRPLILVDDVVTTGATALSVANLLNKENNLKIWSITSRGLAVTPGL